MNKETITKLFTQFLNTYNQQKSSETWQAQSNIFQKFWKEKIFDDQTELSIPDDLIPIVQILDIKGAGKKESEQRFEGVAYTNVYQNTWYKIFSALKKDKEKKNLVNDIFNAEIEEDLISLLDGLFELNKVNRIPALIGNNAIVINVFLFAYNPKDNISMVSLADRYNLIDFFNLGDSTTIINLSYGNKIVRSRDLVLSFKEKYQMDIDNRGISCFFYYDPMKEIWKTGKGFTQMEKEEISLLLNKLQIILYGPPGTGKTYKTKSISIELIESD